MGDAPGLEERFRLMWVMRAFEEACASGVETGELRGELHLGVGQEGVAAAMAGALRREDWVVSTHRSHLHAIAKGVPLGPLMAEVFEKATGLCGGKGGHVHLFDLARRFSNTGIVGSSLPVALGHAYAARLAGTTEVAVGITGDGGVNTGQFHETLNLAAAWRLPLVVLVENNRWAISVPAGEVTAGPGIAERAGGYGMWGRRVDGTDVEATAEAFGEAVASARGGAGPTLLEATCHRFRGHYEGDPDHYRGAEEKRLMLASGDPIALARAKLAAGGWAGEALDGIERDARAEVGEVLAAARAAPDPAPEEALTDVFAGTSR